MDGELDSVDSIYFGLCSCRERLEEEEIHGVRTMDTFWIIKSVTYHLLSSVLPNHLTGVMSYASEDQISVF